MIDRKALGEKNVQEIRGVSAAQAGIFSSSFGFDYPNSAAPQRAALRADAQHWDGFYVVLSQYLKVTCFLKTLTPTYYILSI